MRQPRCRRFQRQQRGHNALSETAPAPRPSSPEAVPTQRNVLAMVAYPTKITQVKREAAL